MQPTSGEAVWFLSTGLSKPLFERLLAAFAREVGAGRERHVVLVPGNLGVSAQRRSPARLSRDDERLIETAEMLLCAGIACHRSAFSRRT